VNHEYTNPELMFRNYEGFANQTAEQTEIELQAHGLTVVEVFRNSAGRWSYVVGSRFNRRVTATTPMEVTGPAAGSDWLETKGDPTGRRVLGTLNHSAGGQAPWGTVLSGEKNFHQYFANAGAVTNAAARSISRSYGLPEGNGSYPWARHQDRFALPVSLDGVELKINGRSASVSFVSTNQINAQAPDDDVEGRAGFEVFRDGRSVGFHLCLPPLEPGDYPMMGETRGARTQPGLLIRIGPPSKTVSVINAF
jgi:hypothetical protein